MSDAQENNSTNNEEAAAVQATTAQAIASFEPEVAASAIVPAEVVAHTAPEIPVDNETTNDDNTVVMHANGNSLGQEPQSNATDLDALKFAGSKPAEEENSVANAIANVQSGSAPKNVFISHGSQEVYDKFIQLARDDGKVLSRGGQLELVMSPKQARKLYEQAALMLGENFADVARINVPRSDTGVIGRIKGYFSTNQIHVVGSGSLESIDTVIKETMAVAKILQKNNLLDDSQSDKKFDRISYHDKNQPKDGKDSSIQDILLNQKIKNTEGTFGAGKPIEIDIKRNGSILSFLTRDKNKQVDELNGIGAFTARFKEALDTGYTSAQSRKTVKFASESIEVAIRALPDGDREGKDGLIRNALQNIQGLKDNYRAEAKAIGGYDHEKGMVHLAALMVRANEDPQQFKKSAEILDRQPQLVEKIKQYFTSAREDGAALSPSDTSVQNALKVLVDTKVLNSLQAQSVKALVSGGVYDFKLNRDISQNLTEDQKSLVKRVFEAMDGVQQGGNTPEDASKAQETLKQAKSELQPSNLPEAAKAHFTKTLDAATLSVSIQEQATAMTTSTKEISDIKAGLAKGDFTAATAAKDFSKLEVIAPVKAIQEGAAGYQADVAKFNELLADTKLGLAAKTMDALNLVARQPEFFAAAKKDDLALILKSLEDPKLAATLHALDPGEKTKLNPNYEAAVSTLKAAILERTPVEDILSKLDPLITSKMQPNEVAQVVTQLKDKVDTLGSYDVESLKELKGTATQSLNPPDKTAIDSKFDALISAKEADSKTVAGLTNKISELTTAVAATGSDATVAVGKVASIVEDLVKDSSSLSKLLPEDIKALKEQVDAVAKIPGLSDTQKSSASALGDSLSSAKDNSQADLSGNNFNKALDKLADPRTDVQDFQRIVQSMAEVKLTPVQQQQIASRIDDVVKAVEKTETRETTDTTSKVTDQDKVAAAAEKVNKKLVALEKLGAKMEGSPESPTKTAGQSIKKSVWNKQASRVPKQPQSTTQNQPPAQAPATAQTVPSAQGAPWAQGTPVATQPSTPSASTSTSNTTQIGAPPATNANTMPQPTTSARTLQEARDSFDTEKNALITNIKQQDLSNLNHETFIGKVTVLENLLPHLQGRGDTNQKQEKDLQTLYATALSTVIDSIGDKFKGATKATLKTISQDNLDNFSGALKNTYKMVSELSGSKVADQLDVPNKNVLVAKLDEVSKLLKDGWEAVKTKMESPASAKNLNMEAKTPSIPSPGNVQQTDRFSR